MTAAIIAAQIVGERGYTAADMIRLVNIVACRTCFEDRVSNLHWPATVDAATLTPTGVAGKVPAKGVVDDGHRRALPVVDGAADGSRVAAQSAVGNRQCPDVDDSAAIVVAIVRVATQSAVDNRQR